MQWIEEIPPGRFYLRVGLGRKASGSYYTPHSFVRFLVQETLGPQVAERSPQDDPKPGEILKLKVLDPAMGSGHFLVEACRFLGHHLYEAARLCDERAMDAERRAERAKEKGTGSKRSAVLVLFSGEQEAALQEAHQYRQRVIDLPDPDDEIVRYLPSRSPEGEESGISQRKAEALCRRMVAVHCLYGVDKNPLAVELAKLALWLESHAEGMPLTFLDHRLVVGDSLTGPFWDKLIMRPSDPKEPVEGISHQGLTLALQNKLAEALSIVRHLEATVGVSLSEIEEKERLKAELDQALRPFRIIAAAWSGGVMLGAEKCDDLAYADLLKSVAETGEIPERIESERLRLMTARGLNADDASSDADSLYDLAGSGNCVLPLAYDLTFPEVFYPTGIPHGRCGFDTVLGNPPWDRVRPAKRELLAAFDFDILNVPTAREGKAIEERLLSDRAIANHYEEYVRSFVEQGSIHDALFRWHEVRVGGILAGRGNSDLYIVFMERNSQLLRSGGATGVVVPSGFHANEGATGIRQLYLERMTLTCCFSFENHRKLFEIDSRVKFALVVAVAGKTTETFSCGFYLHDVEWLFRDRQDHTPLNYSLDFVRHTGGDYLSLLELRAATDLEIAQTCFEHCVPFGAIEARLKMSLGREYDMNRDSWRFTPTTEVLDANVDPRTPEIARRLRQMGYLTLYEGKTFRQFDDQWADRPRYLVHVDSLKDKQNWRCAAT
ncbi:MAG: Eco57I restriction-modification methylase domain-containing protein, partial [Planctomycetota bacterium]